MSGDLRKALYGALDRGDRKGAKQIVSQMQSERKLEGFLQALAVFGDYQHLSYLWQLHGLFDPDIEIYGSTLLANASAHGGIERSNRRCQRLALEQLLLMGANPNTNFFPSESTEGASTLSFYSLAILAEIGLETVTPTLENLLEVMLVSGLDLEEESYPAQVSKIQQLALSLSPMKLLEGSALRRVQKNTESPLFIGLPLFPYDVMQTTELFAKLMKAGASVTRSFPTGASDHGISLKSYNVVSLLEHYRKMLDEARCDPSPLRKWLSETSNDWSLRSYVTDPQVLDQASQFYSDVINQLKLRHLEYSGYSSKGNTKGR